MREKLRDTQHKWRLKVSAVAKADYHNAPTNENSPNKTLCD